MSATTQAPAAATAAGGRATPPSAGYRLKRLLLGQPLISSQLEEQRLSKPVAFGVLAPDCISSSAYGTEEMLIVLLPYAGLAAFTLVLPITGIILFILVLLTLSYREIVTTYTKAGGAYVVSRENFGPRIAQIAAVALLIDYVVTVAVQTAAGTVAVVSAVPALGSYAQEITIGAVVLLAWGNLRGIREAGKSFAFPLYFFIAMTGSMIIVGIFRELTGTLPMLDPYRLHGTIPIHHGNGFLEGAGLLVLLRSFANGGSSLTGFEAISNGVTAFRRPEGTNARRTLVVMACTLGFLVGGVSWIAHATHATPYASGYPSVISQEARLVFGAGGFGTVLFATMQAASALVLFTGANTSFNGFPFLASFVADDQFLPRQLTKRGHRLVYSNGILTLAVISIALLAATGAKVDALVPLYAIGVFTGFSMAGFGMVRRQLRQREPGWRYRVVANGAAGVMCAIVVGIFATVKFTEGAWVVVVLFPILVWLFIRLNREYREESRVLGALGERVLSTHVNIPRHMVIAFVDQLDLSTLAALRYGRSLRGTDMRAVHLVLEEAHAQALAEQWQATVDNVPLDLVLCPDRRLAEGAVDYVRSRIPDAATEVTVLLPRRGYSPLLGRLLHDRTADKLATALSEIPNVAPTIVPYDTRAVRERITARLAKEDSRAAADAVATVERRDALAEYTAPTPPPDVDSAGSVVDGRRCAVQGRIDSVEVRSLADSPVFTATLVDATGRVTLQFLGRRNIPGIEPGRLLRAEGFAQSRGGARVIMNPRYSILEDRPASE